uniref:Transcription initiation factor IIE subunit beta n=1 Tax=Romanomermis culicivorax TaxID=13658 RepID=A0A915IWU4_ROMCU
MDPALLKQRDAFLKRAAATPTVFKKNEKRPAAVNDELKPKVSKKVKSQPTDGSQKQKAPAFDYKTAKASMVASFGNLAKIVDHMKKRHLEQSSWSLTFDEILEEAQMLDLNNKTKQWLLEALPRNPRIAVDKEGKFIFKPPYKIKGKNSLLQVLKRHDLEGKAGILMSELAECIPNPEKSVKDLAGAVIVINTNINKRKDRVLFYNDVENSVPIDEEFKALWRSVALDHLDEKKIDEYLHKHGIDSMKDLPQKKILGTGQAPKRKNVRRKGTIMHNEHLKESGLLVDYSND